MTTAHINSISPIAYVQAVFAREPSVTLGVLVSAGIELEQALVAAKPLTWQAAVPVILSVLVRFFVSPASAQQSPATAAPVASAPAAVQPAA